MLDQPREKWILPYINRGCTVWVLNNFSAAHFLREIHFTQKKIQNVILTILGTSKFIWMALVHWHFSRLQINQNRFHVKSERQKTSWISSLWTGLPTTKYKLHHHRGYKVWTWTKFNKEYLLLSYGIGKKMGNRWLEKIWKYCLKFPKICKQKSISLRIAIHNNTSVL